ncbi:MAG: hypothetical protein FWD81_04140 [Methanomassiliicoccaceae archaeon]|nr:hypothetical protein [Methanomassiliicoccaceae archaeon]
MESNDTTKIKKASVLNTTGLYRELNDLVRVMIELEKEKISVMRENTRILGEISKKLDK